MSISKIYFLRLNLKVFLYFFFLNSFLSIILFCAALLLLCMYICESRNRWKKYSNTSFQNCLKLWLGGVQCNTQIDRGHYFQRYGYNSFSLIKSRSKEMVYWSPFSIQAWFQQNVSSTHLWYIWCQHVQHLEILKQKYYLSTINVFINSFVDRFEG